MSFVFLFLVFTKLLFSPPDFRELQWVSDTALLLWFTSFPIFFCGSGLPFVVIYIGDLEASQTNSRKHHPTILGGPLMANHLRCWLGRCSAWNGFRANLGIPLPLPYTPRCLWSLLCHFMPSGNLGDWPFIRPSVVWIFSIPCLHRYDLVQAIRGTEASGALLPQLHLDYQL